LKQNVSNHAGRLDEALAWERERWISPSDSESDHSESLATTMLEQTYFMRGDYQRVVDPGVSQSRRAGPRRRAVRV